MHISILLQEKSCSKISRFENFGKVYLADNKALEIERKGDVCINITSGNKRTLEDVRYIPGLKKNLISVG